MLDADVDTFPGAAASRSHFYLLQFTHRPRRQLPGSLLLPIGLEQTGANRVTSDWIGAVTDRAPAHPPHATKLLPTPNKKRLPPSFHPAATPAAAAEQPTSTTAARSGPQQQLWSSFGVASTKALAMGGATSLGSPPP